MSAVYIGLLAQALAPAAEPAPSPPLRLVGYGSDGREFTTIAAEKSVLGFANDKGELEPIPRGTHWRLEGKLIGHEASLFFNPKFTVVTRPNHSIRADQRTRTYAIVRQSQSWPWEDARDFVQAVIVVLWLVDGRPTRVIPVAANTEDGASDFVKAVVAFELTPAEQQGRPVVMLLQNGKWSHAARWFDDKRVDAAFAHLHLNPEFDFDAAIQGVKSSALWTRLRGYPMLYLVSATGFAGATTTLLESGHAEYRNFGDNTGLHVAVRGNYRDVAAALIAGGIKVGVSDGRGTRPFEVAIENGHLELACELLGEKPQREDLRAALRLALEQADASVIERLLARGGDRLVRKLRPEDFSAILEIGEPALIQRLLPLGMHLKDERPLLHAAASGHATIVQALLDAGAPVNARAPDGTSALMMAAARADGPVVQVLHRAGADLNQPNRFGETPLSIATRVRNEAAAAYLANEGANEGPGLVRARARDPKTRWITDYLQPDRDPVFDEMEVTLPPVEQTRPGIDVLKRINSRSSATTQTQYHTDARTGQVTESTVTTAVPNYYSGSSGEFWAVVSMIVEKDGTVSHAVVVDSDSEETWLAVDKVIDRFTFSPGEHQGQRVRTRVTLSILSSD